MNLAMQKEFFDDFSMRFSAETIRGYKIAINQFFTFCDKNYNQIKATDIRAWLAHMEETGLKPNSIHLKLSAVKSFYRYCIEENKLKKNPTLSIHTPQKDDSLPYYLSKRKIALLQELTRDDLRNRAIVETLYATGVRISELLNIRIEDVKWEKRLIWIREGKGNKERYVLFTAECAERLKVYHASRQKDSPYLISNQRGERLSRVFVQQQFQNFSEVLGFRVKPHTLRHTFAAHLAEKGMKQIFIQHLLGHANYNSSRIYTRLMEHAQKRIYDKYQI